MDKIDVSVFRETERWMSGWQSPVLISHSRPDGDALGSLVAMRALLAGRGVSAQAILFDPLPDRYAGFRRFSPLNETDAQSAIAALNAADGLIVLDTCTYSQLEPIADWLRGARIPRLAIDHHATRDELADRYLVDASAPATCSILYEWADAAGWSIGHEAAEALYVGIATDTGWFRHSNTDARALAQCADLVALGVRPFEWYESIYQRDPARRVRLLGEALAALEFHSNDRLAISTLSREAFERWGGRASDTEDVVNEPMRVAAVVVSALLVEQDDGLIRVNLRSKPPSVENGRPDIDVASLAQKLGGGGHRRAAGARIAGTLAEVRRRVVAELAKALGT